MKIEGQTLVICQLCTLLQKSEDVPFEVTFDFSLGNLSVDYYPFLLEKKKLGVGDTCMFFSLKSMEVLLQKAGYKVNNARLNGDKLEVFFEKLDTTDRIRLYEKAKKLGSQFTFFLFSVKK